MLLYGEAGGSDRLIERFKLKLKKNTDGVTEVAEQFAHFCREDARAAADVPMHPDYFPDFGFLIAGLDKKGKKYNIPLFYTLDSLRGFRLGLRRKFEIEGKKMIALYLFSKGYRANMSLEDVLRLVAQAMYDTRNIDSTVGGQIRIAIIDAVGTREIPEEDVESFTEPWSVSRLRHIAKER
jgi:20S proteasome alpha/beta subunit